MFALLCPKIVDVEQVIVSWVLQAFLNFARLLSTGINGKSVSSGVCWCNVRRADQMEKEIDLGFQAVSSRILTFTLEVLSERSDHPRMQRNIRTEPSV